MFLPNLSLVKLEASSSGVVIDALASRLLAGGHVRPTFPQAARAREKKSPTGLPFAPWAVALPHADPEHVVKPAIALATLKTPVAFRQMGSPELTLSVSIAVMPAFSAKAQAAASLTRLIALLQVEAVRESIIRAGSPEALLAELALRWDQT
jgi:galactitol PTS system EIIA component